MLAESTEFAESTLIAAPDAERVPRHADCMSGAAMDRHDTAQPDRNADPTTEAGEPASDGETHATTAGAVAAGAVTGGVIGLTGGPLGAALGAVGGAIVAAAAERMMHGHDEDTEDTENTHFEASHS